MTEQATVRNGATKAAQLARQISDRCGDTIHRTYVGREGAVPADVHDTLRHLEGQAERLHQRIADMRRSIDTNGGGQ